VIHGRPLREASLVYQLSINAGQQPELKVFLLLFLQKKKEFCSFLKKRTKKLFVPCAERRRGVPCGTLTSMRRLSI
jgi:hypothetical protein